MQNYIAIVGNLGRNIEGNPAEKDANSILGELVVAAALEVVLLVMPVTKYSSEPANNRLFDYSPVLTRAR